MPKHTSKQDCLVCRAQPSKYTCSKCMLPYCSVACYKTHKDDTKSLVSPDPCLPATNNVIPDAQPTETESLTASEEIDTEPPPLRPLTSLKWPYVEEESAFPDPLKRDDPKPLQLHQYEAIATSPAIRDILSTNPNLRDVLRNIDQLRGEDRQDALQKALGVSANDTKAPEIRIGSVGTVRGANEDDVKALRRLAEAVEGVVRGGKEGTLGLDWGDS